MLAIRFLHSRKICHRDIKTDNVLIDKKGHLVLSDFGLAIQLTGSNTSNELVGTTEYIAPGICFITINSICFILIIHKCINTFRNFQARRLSF